MANVRRKNLQTLQEDLDVLSEAEPVDDLPHGRGWLYEPRYDGFPG